MSDLYLDGHESTRSMKTINLVILLLVGVSSFVEAASLNIKFGEDAYIGLGVVQGGSTWNFIPNDAGSSVPLVDSSGAPTPFSLEFSAQSLFVSPGSTPGTDPEKLLESGLYGPYSFTISGLDSDQRYSVYTFHYDKAGNSTTTELSGLLTNTQTPTGTAIEASFVEGGNYLAFENVLPSLSGQISGSSDVAFGGLNGIQIVTVPEANMFALVCGGLAGLFVLSRSFGRRI